MKRFVLLLLLTLSSFTVRGWSRVVSNISIDVRLKTPVSSQHSRAGDPVETVTVAPVVMQDRVIVPGGSIVRGYVQAVRELNEHHRQAGLLLKFTHIDLPSGETVAIDGQVSEVDNARETVSSDGWIDGQRPISVKPSKLQSLLLVFAPMHPVTLAALEGVQFLRREAAHLQIAFAPGVDMTIKAPLLSLPAEGALAVDAPVPDGQLTEAVLGLPIRASSSGVRTPADVTNIVLIGTRSDVEHAFVAAGWSTTAKLNLRSGFKAFFAAAEQHPYRQAPVSKLLLNSRKPDLVFQKQTDTFAKRHHIRLWQEGVTFDGRSIWVGAATHDVAITFSYAKGFSHKVDAAIDLERTKVVNDLIFSGSAAFQGLVDRPSVPKLSVNASGDPLQTDGRIAILTMSGWRSEIASADPAKVRP